MNCGYENAENARICQGCGSVLAVEQPSMPKRMLGLLNDNLFMILCTLYSVSIGFSLIDGNAPVVRILTAIFLWMVFAKSKNGILNSNSVRNISGTIFASYVIQMILCCLVAFCGLLLGILSCTIDTGRLWDVVDHAVRPFTGAYLAPFAELAKYYLLVISAVLIIFAGTGLCFNVFGWRSIHRFVQSIYKSLECGQINLTRRGAAQRWMLVFGILHAISVVLALARGNMVSFIEDACLSAVFIMGRILVRKYFGDLHSS